MGVSEMFKKLLWLCRSRRNKGYCRGTERNLDRAYKYCLLLLASLPENRKEYIALREITMRIYSYRNKLYVFKSLR
ncbi:hypothetical protein PHUNDERSTRUCK_52 [Escherichia phage vB_EcoD_Phunderstruck]|nr:hypothetical protein PHUNDERSTRUCK_52 [Escherichia phage vB_EcoD_Phunderstruck]UGO55821.1 hypothetical protein JLBYU01_26 [Escherichia phage JLBYU01]